MTNQEKYRLLCENEPSIPVFSRAWWLDSVAPDMWDVVLVEKNGVINAALPFTLHQRFGMTIIGQPQLTQKLGPWLRSSTAKYSRKLSQEKDLLQCLFKKLPEFSHYNQNWHHVRTNWLPLYWKGYVETTRYTYRINDLSNSDKIWEGFEANIRTDIRKAANKENVKVRTDLGLDAFFALNEKVFSRQNITLPYSKALVQSIDENAIKHNARQIFIAEDQYGRHHAGVYLIWDEESAYYLMGGGDPKLRSSGATSLCMWEAIQFSAGVTKSFDFEGSMLEPVERFFRGFGAIQTPYFEVSKTNSKLLSCFRFLQSLKSD